MSAMLPSLPSVDSQLQGDAFTCLPSDTLGKNFSVDCRLWSQADRLSRLGGSGKDGSLDFA